MIVGSVAGLRGFCTGGLSSGSVVAAVAAPTPDPGWREEGGSTPGVESLFLARLIDDHEKALGS